MHAAGHSLPVPDKRPWGRARRRQIIPIRLVRELANVRVPVNTDSLYSSSVSECSTSFAAQFHRQKQVNLEENDIQKRYWAAAGVRGAALGEVPVAQVC